MQHPRRRVPLVVVVLAACLALSGCTSAPAAVPAPIRVVANEVSPFPPANSVWYSYATLRAKRPFARWEQERDRIELVTWPRDCAHVPVAISFTPGDRVVAVETGRAPRAYGPRQCSPGHVLTSTFVGPRAMRRDRSTVLELDGARVLLPPAPGMETAPVPLTVSRAGDTHPLRQIDRPLPQYSVRDSPWNLTAPVSPSSTTVFIGWIGGTCGRNASLAYVVETAKTVTIDIALAPPPVRPRPPRYGPAVVCAGVGISLSATIHLSRPLGHRTLLQHQDVHRPADQNAF